MKSALALIALMSAGLLAGCGFTPVYGDQGVGSNLSRIAVSTQDDRLGYRLREQLEDALGWNGNAAPAWRLETSVKQERRSLGRLIDDTASRYELTVIADWTLTPMAGGEPVKGVQRAVVTYASADQPYAAIAAQQDGEERAAEDLSRLIRQDLMRVLATQ